ncbi:hypothetical protein KDM41_11030 [bacterium]|nr:hypothetical protein [bacterium]
MYASLDRRLVSAPLIVENTHEGWNDLGANITLAWGRFGADVFAINGSNCGRGQVSPDKFIARLDIRRALGSRLHVAPRDGLELGVSSAYFRDEADDLAMIMWGGDLQASAGRFSAKGEYLVQRTDRGTAAEADNRGWYLQGLAEFGRVFGVARYGVWDPELTPERPERLSLGLGYVVRPGLEFRVEHDLGLTDLDDVTSLQMVMDFGGVH